MTSSIDGLNFSDTLFRTNDSDVESDVSSNMLKRIYATSNPSRVFALGQKDTLKSYWIKNPLFEDEDLDSTSHTSSPTTDNDSGLTDSPLSELSANRLSLISGKSSLTSNSSEEISGTMQCNTIVANSLAGSMVIKSSSDHPRGFMMSTLEVEKMKEDLNAGRWDEYLQDEENRLRQEVLEKSPSIMANEDGDTLPEIQRDELPTSILCTVRFLHNGCSNNIHQSMEYYHG